MKVFSHIKNTCMGAGSGLSSPEMQESSRSFRFCMTAYNCGYWDGLYWLQQRHTLALDIAARV